MSDELQSELSRLFAYKGGVVGVCGLPGAGKSTLVRTLSENFGGRALCINLDDFCIAETPRRKSYLAVALANGDMKELESLARPEHTKDNPFADPLSWYDWNAAACTLDELKSGRAVIRGEAWNQDTGLCDKTVVYRPPVSENPVYFVDCVYLFEEPLRSKIDVFVKIEMSPEVSFEREKNRDSHRNSEIYAAYKKMVTDIYCVPYLAKHHVSMDFIVT